MLALLYLVACQGAPATPTPVTPPPSPTVQVIIVPVVATSVPTDTPPPTVTPVPASPTALPPPQTPLRATTPTRAPATATRPRPTATAASSATPAPPAGAPATLLDGDYASTGSMRVQFTVSGSGTLASDGFFNFHCSVDGALETYSFAKPAAVVDGKFAFSALVTASGTPQVSMVCTATGPTQARCTIRDVPATNKCLDTPANVSRK